MYRLVEPMTSSTAANSIFHKRLVPIEKLRSVAESLKYIARPHRLRMIASLLAGEQTVEAIAPNFANYNKLQLVVICV